MTSKIFINLPVKNLQNSMDFFKALGFSFNMQFTDEKAGCMVIKEGSIFAMLLEEDYFATFTKKPIADATKTTEVLIALDLPSKAAVDEMVKNAVEAGGSTYMEAADHGWMYQHSFADLDGHQWELAYMDESKIPQ
ncbi:glyoxalase/bleomycin resistance/extradiol dioxygenase family protein [Marivirga sp. S37H4]|uniref:Glyoxalase/bleomycin resistance/extradiol dioxygenase family protein n=1 Tax=Marivirga aurantiaca TaxID=2802615 RepID=A0A934X160_9BACT|nr:VOC family protein [Marivirga aurantiaca]MBK6266586.1 glyoxalase/bleomycin resistance/extradiol dioxygenase family protein [Marivirga aurantiaca]